MKNFILFLGAMLFVTTLISCNSSPANEQVNSAFGKSDTLNTSENEKARKASSWILDGDRSEVSFIISNFGREVDGTLSGLKANIYFDENEPLRSSFEASVKVNTINTGISKRDKDLMHEKYLDGEKYPEIIFRSDTIFKNGDGFITGGMLTIKGKSLHKEIPFTFQQAGNTGTFAGKFSFKRLDYGIGGSGPIMGEEVNVSLKVIALKK